MKILYIAGVATPEYRVRHGHAGMELGGDRKAQLSLDALTRGGHEVMLLSSAGNSVSRLEWIREERERWTLATQEFVEVRYPGRLAVRPIGGLINSLRAPWLAGRLLNEFVPDVTVSYNTSLVESLASLTVKGLTGAPILLQIEDLPLARRREYGNLKPWLDRCCWPYMLREASAFTAVNQSILSMLPPHKPKRLLPGIIDDRLMHASERRVPPFSGTTRSLGYFGGLSAEKGVRVLLEVASSLPEDWRLKVAGSGPLEADFASLARSTSERVEFLGKLGGEALFEALCSCDATVVPREQISGDRTGVFPFKVLEYLIARTHIISTPLAGIGDVDMGFSERWDGSVDGLRTELRRAPAAYEEEHALRAAALDAATSRFTVAGASAVFSSLLSAVHTA